MDGRQWLDLDGLSAGTISQTFQTLPNQMYVLSFAYANNAAWPTAQAQITIVDASTAIDLTPPFSITHGTSTFSNYDWLASGPITFTALGRSTVLEFKSLDSSASRGGIFLDAIELLCVGCGDCECPVDNLPPLQQDMLPFERAADPTTCESLLDWDGVSTALINATSEFESRVLAEDSAADFRVTAAYRPVSYQEHLYQIREGYARVLYSGTGVTACVSRWSSATCNWHFILPRFLMQAIGGTS
jgi:hypothetical protein